MLDVGCGPGRLVAELAGQGRTALGVDVSDAAVAHSRAFGGQALCRSVFDPLPGEGRWDTVLLMDGNIGIGGEPAALLARVVQLLAPGGMLIVEAAPVDVDERASVQVTDSPGQSGGHPFPWARLGTPALLRYAAGAGLRPVDQWSVGGRCFAALRTRTASTSAEPANSAAVSSSQWPRYTSAERPVADR